MKFKIYLDQPYFDFVSQNKTTFGGWDQKPDHFTIEILGVSQQTDNEVFLAAILPMIQQFHRAANSLKIDDPGKEIGKVIAPSGWSLPVIR